MNGHDFKESQKVFKAMSKELKRNGKGGVDHKTPLAEEDLLKLYQYFGDNDNNIRLQQRVFVDIMLHLARRGRENLRVLKTSDFSIKTDASNDRYISLDIDEQTKNHQDDDEGAKGRLYEVKGKFSISLLRS